MTALASGVAAQQPRPPQPGTTLSVEQLQAQMFRVSAGRRLKPKAWPNGARVAVGLTFDVDNVSPSLANGNVLVDVLSRGEYGAIDGLPRILRLLDKYQLPGTFFVPAVSQLMHPQIIPSIMAAGRHEVGVHGWIHENLPALNDPAAEQRLLNQAIETLTKAGAISTDSASASDRCVKVENQRSDSISSPNSSIRTARSSVAG